ncbi:MAG: hypothetical protein KDA28_00815, partial [Phycisphaerales bacterium]|nr:hypothetical protein [Phycisphaerales bacterium]
GTASTLFDSTVEDMAWIVGVTGFEMTLSDETPRHVARGVRSLVESIPDVPSIEDLGPRALWCVHPGGPRILDAIAEALEIPSSDLGASRDILRRFGNMSSVTTLFILDRLRRGGTPATDRPILAMAFGPGLTGEAAWLTLEGAGRDPDGQ